MLEQYQARQKELRKVIGQVQRFGTAIAADRLQQAVERVRDLEATEDARVASHLAMIHVVAELGGTAKLQLFYKQYADIRDRLARDPQTAATELLDKVLSEVKSVLSKGGSEG